MPFTFSSSRSLRSPCGHPVRWVRRTAALRGLRLDTVDWTVRAGEHWALLGPNDAGKTSVLHLVGDTTLPTTGTVEASATGPAASTCGSCAP